MCSRSARNFLPSWRKLNVLPTFSARERARAFDLHIHARSVSRDIKVRSFGQVPNRCSAEITVPLSPSLSVSVRKRFLRRSKNAIEYTKLPSEWRLSPASLSSPPSSLSPSPEPDEYLSILRYKTDADTAYPISDQKNRPRPAEYLVRARIGSRLLEPNAEEAICARYCIKHIASAQTPRVHRLSFSSARA